MRIKNQSIKVYMTNCIAINVICFTEVPTIAFTKRSETRWVETGQFGVYLSQKYHIFCLMVDNCIIFFIPVQCEILRLYYNKWRRRNYYRCTFHSALACLLSFDIFVVFWVTRLFLSPSLQLNFFLPTFSILKFCTLPTPYHKILLLRTLNRSRFPWNLPSSRG